MKPLRLTYMLVFASFFLSACSTDFDVTAPEKEIFAVYGVLDATHDTQHIKITKVFQFEGSAYAFASENDLSIHGLDVRLLTDGKTYIANEVNDQPRDEGIFFETQTIYEFATAGADALVPGKTYTLEIRKPGNDSFLLTAFTRIPREPEFTNPRGPYHLADSSYVNPRMEFNQEQVISFRNKTGIGYELRLFTDFVSGGITHTARWGPTKVFLESVHCGEAASTVCYSIPKNQVILAIMSDLAPYQGDITYDEGIISSDNPDLLGKTCRIEATAIDTFLTTYLGGANSFGFGLNLLMDKPEFSNLTGTIDAVGIFGSIHRSETIINLGFCTQYLSGLLEPPLPNGCHF